MFKRIIDFSAALAGLILLSPVFLVLYVLVRIRMGSPVFFIQRRPGLLGKPFRMIKFRTLSNEKDDDGHLLPEDERKTSLGTIMRKTSLDELPELFNVLKGDMSLVGPRPLTMYYLPLYDAHQARRHEVRPGITGWAQVNGRSKVSWEDKFDMDVWYVDHQSPWLDLKILCKTIIQVFQQTGTTAVGGDFTKPFRGTGTGTGGRCDHGVVATEGKRGRETMSLRWNTERPVTLREHGGASVLVGNRGINCEPPLTRHRKQNVSRNRNVYFTLSRRFRNVQLSRMTDAGDFT